VQAIISAFILLASQINETIQGAYQMLIDAAIILYFIPFLYMFAAVFKLANRPDRKQNTHAVLVPGGKLGVWICGGLGFLVVFIGIAVSVVPPGESTSPVLFVVKLVLVTTASVLVGLILYWRGARSKTAI
jgi:amino acid transporter